MGRAKKASRDVLLEGTSLVIGNWSASHKFMGLEKFQGSLHDGNCFRLEADLDPGTAQEYVQVQGDTHMTSCLCQILVLSINSVSKSAAVGVLMPCKHQTKGMQGNHCSV